jgi:hypothetical protein
MRLEHRELAAEDVLRLPRLALPLRLADARDHAQARVERGPRPLRHGLVGLAEVLPPLGVAHESADDAELEQQRRRDLARVRALRLPVHVLCVRGQPGLDAFAQPGERRADDGVEPGEGGGIRPAEHLPVARDQHGVRIVRAGPRDARRETHPS